MNKIYQVQRFNLTPYNDGHNHGHYTYDVQMNVIAEYEVKETFDSNDMLCEDLWDACNITCWDRDWQDGDDIIKEKTITHPKSCFPGFCNSDIIIETPDGKFYKADSIGFREVESLEDGMYLIIDEYSFINWENIQNKSDFDVDKLKSVVEKYNQDKAA